MVEIDRHPDRIYLDHNATTPFCKDVREKIPEWLSAWGNPSSIHWAGRGPKSLLREARKNVAHLVGCHPLELVFTSGGSEANNMAIKGIYYALKNSPKPDNRQRNQYILSAVEHPTVTKTMEFLKSQGAQVDVVPVNRSGEIDTAHYQSLLSENTALVSIMYANNETGNIFPVAKLAKMAHQVGALYHCDGVQALGKAVTDVKKWDVDLASFSGHKFYALNGCGALYCKKGIHMESLIHGGGQERGRRAGTENLLAIASFGEMATRAHLVQSKAGELKKLRDLLETRLLTSFSDIQITGGLGKRLPNTVSLVISGVDGETLLMNLDMNGVSVSTGAACSSGNPEPSPVLLAMGLSPREAQSSLRLSLGWGTTSQDILQFVEILETVVTRLRSFQ